MESWPDLEIRDLSKISGSECKSGVDIPAVSRWLCRKEGGALAMKTRGHLLDPHSAYMARKVVFSELASNVVPLPLTTNVAEDNHTASRGNDAEKKSIAKAKAKYGHLWWASKNALDVFWGQLN